ncbi:hypothetical protein AB0D11_02455 [Streptomyces monashensis]|uniref:hypothetical protein n=1 Tax=Streptomyces monashensis TaxID=1678012 RepID=UPI0033C917E7
MLYALLAVAALAPGLITVWRLRHRGWGLALLAGIGVTAALPFVLISGMVAFPPLGFVVGVGATLAALRDYDSGKIWHATGWASLAVVVLACAGWFR